MQQCSNVHHVALCAAWMSSSFVYLSQGLAFAKEHGLVFMETSAKTSANVEEVQYSIPLTLAPR